MNAKTKHLAQALGQSQLARPKYSAGLLLQDDDLTQAVDYTRGLSRLLMRSMLGCGVICGFVVKAVIECKGKLEIRVASGIALDCPGDPIHVPEPQSLYVDPSCGAPIPEMMWVLLRRRDKCCAPRTAACSPEDDDDMPSVCTRERDGFEIRVVEQLPGCVCGCPNAEGLEPACTPSHNGTGGAEANRPVTGTTATTGTVVSERQAADATGADAAATPAADTTGTAGGAAPAAAPAAARPAGGKADDKPDCACADPASACYESHYKGDCGCGCMGATGACRCDCEWVLLARIDRNTGRDSAEEPWKVAHHVRRFVRPMLMRDPQAWEDAQESRRQGA